MGGTLDGSVVGVFMFKFKTSPQVVSAFRGVRPDDSVVGKVDIGFALPVGGGDATGSDN